jgi:hypothetical protein
MHISRTKREVSSGRSVNQIRKTGKLLTDEKGYSLHTATLENLFAEAQDEPT